MKKSEIIKNLKEKIPSTTLNDVEDRFNYIIDLIKSNIKNNNIIEIRKLGRFSLRKRKGYVMVNPKTKKHYNISPHKTVYFKSSKTINEFINFGTHAEL